MPSGEPEVETIGRYNKAEAANVALLDELLKEEVFTLPDKVVWVERLNPFDRIKNPSFRQLFMLHPGEVGFGFDADNGLAVVSPSEIAVERDNGAFQYELKQYVYWVQYIRNSDAVAEAKGREEPTVKFSLGIRAPHSAPSLKKNPLGEETEEFEGEDDDVEMEEDDQEFW